MESPKYSDGFKAMALATLGVVAMMGDFGGERALRSASDSIYAGGHHAGKKYFVDHPGSATVFYCSNSRNVIMQETVTGETGEPETSYKNMGHKEACPDGAITKEDGEVWATEPNKLGLLGVLFN